MSLPDIHYCPFCRKFEIEIQIIFPDEKDSDDHRVFATVYCNNCGATGPSMAGENENDTLHYLIKVWNQVSPNAMARRLVAKDRFTITPIGQ